MSVSVRERTAPAEPHGGELGLSTSHISSVSVSSLFDEES